MILKDPVESMQTMESKFSMFTWVRFGFTLGLPWGHSDSTFGITLVTLGSLWGHYGITQGSLADDFGVTLGSLWGHIGVTLGPL